MERGALGLRGFAATKCALEQALRDLGSACSMSLRGTAVLPSSAVQLSSKQRMSAVRSWATAW